MNIKPVIRFLITTLVLLPLLSFSQELTLLEEVRDDIVFPELSPDEKRIVAEQAQILLRDLYVHRYNKLEYYPYLEDPVPAIERIVDSLDNLTVTEMEEAIYNVFVSQRDLHLNFIFPSPYADYDSFLPLTFTRTSSRAGFFEVRVNALNESLFEQFAPDQRIPQIGDRVVRYNGMPIRAAVSKQLATAQGANTFGGFTRALGQMTFVSHLLHLVPEENSVEMTLQGSGQGFGGADYYTITLPWIAADYSFAASTSKTPAITPHGIGPKARPLKREDINQAVDLWQQKFNEFTLRFGLRPHSEYPDNPSAEPVLTWGLIENDDGAFGYLRLNSFVPATGDAATLQEIRRIVLTEFAATDGLMFDVRNNGGGSGTLASSLSQFFTRNEAEPAPVRLLNTDLNRTLLNESILGPLVGPETVEAINEAEGTGNTHTALVPFIYPEEVNQIGQIYYKPVAVLANARSYSASDLFTCEMQDNRAALIYGEDPLTGAGGANVIEHSLFNLVLPSVFETLPGNHRMRVSWRQMVRAGLNAGKLVEDFGCAANFDISQTKNDLLNGSETQIKKITRSLAARSQSPRYRASGRPVSGGSEIVLSRDDLNLEFYATNTHYVNIYINGDKYTRMPVFAGEEEVLVTADLPLDLPLLTSQALKFEGVDWSGKILWNFKRQVVLLEEKVTVDEGGFEIDFSTADTTGPLAIVNRGPAGEGWNLVSPYLQVGYDPAYTDNVDTDAIALLDLTGISSAQLAFDMEVDTEADFDFMEVYIEDDNGARRSLLRESGFHPYAPYSFDLSTFAGRDNIVLHFRFISDAFVTAPGVRIGRIAID